MLNKNRIIIILSLIILGLLILIYYKHNQVQGIKRSVIASWERSLKQAVNTNRSALVNIASLPSDSNDSKPIVLGSLDGKPLVPCKKINFNTSSQNYKSADKLPSKNNNDCSSSTINVDDKTRKAFDALGTYPLTIHNGEKTIETNVHLIMITSRHGSYCSTTYIAGDQYEKCITQQEICDDYRAYIPFPFWTLNEFITEFPECNGLIHI